MTQSELEFTPLNEQRILFLMDVCKETQHRITSCTNSVVNTERWNIEHFAENIKKASLSKQLTETSICFRQVQSIPPAQNLSGILKLNKVCNLFP